MVRYHRSFATGTTGSTTAVPLAQLSQCPQARAPCSPKYASRALPRQFALSAYCRIMSIRDRRSVWCRSNCASASLAAAAGSGA
jgi:hypothetical protein